MTAERPFYIYCHTAPNGKRYIGQTCLDPEKRWDRGRGYIKCTLMHRAIEKYGWDNFRHDIICVVHSKEAADLFEQHYIDKFDTFNDEHGYNLTKGGGGVVGCTWSEERKAAHSEAIRGTSNGMYRRHHTEESRKKMSEKLRGRYIPPEQIEFCTNVLLEANKKRQVPICQLDLDGNLVARYDGFGDAERRTGFEHGNLVLCCQGKNDKAYGFRWEYEDPELRAKADEVRRNRPTNSMAIIQLTPDGVEVARFSSMTEAQKVTGLNRNKISNCCHGGSEAYAGYRWEFVDEGLKHSKGPAVIQFDLNGCEIARFATLSEASDLTGTPRKRIRDCCCGRANSANGSKWDFVDKSLKTKKLGVKNGVIQLDMSGNEIARYGSLSKAMSATGHDRHRIVECCNGERESYRNTRWQYQEQAA